MNLSRFFRNAIRIQPNIFLRIWLHQKMISRYCCARRALLYVPGSNGNLLNTALKLKVDCIVMDCEKGVKQKDKARQNIRELLDSGPVTLQDPEWCVKINPVQTPEECEEDIISFLSAKNLPVTLCLPKVTNVSQLEWFAEKVWKVLLQRPENDRGPLKLMMHIESTRAMLALPELCQKAEDLSTMAPVIPVALVFENDSLLNSIGARKTESGIEILYARQKLVLVAKAFGLQVIDKPFLNTKDLCGLRSCCKDGVILGFTGKQVIHLDQIVITQEEFTPSRSRIHWAKTVLQEFSRSQNKEQEDLGFDNSLIDGPTRKQAENILSFANAAELKIESAGPLKDHQDQDEL